MIVVENAPPLVAFIEKKLSVRFAPPFHAFGYLTNDQKPLAGVVINDYQPGGNCELTIVAEKGGLTRAVIRHLASHVFNKLGCRRVTVRTRKTNKTVLRLAPRYGFCFESVARHYYPDGDAVVFRMLRADCRWI